MRIVCFLTDGYVGNDMAIIDAVRKNADTTRVFSFGIGNSVNRYLLDGMALAGRGEAEFVTLESLADAAVERFEKRLSAPVLTDIEIDWGGLPVQDVFPRRIPDLFAAKPILVHGRLSGDASGAVTLRGKTASGAFEERVSLGSLASSSEKDALASLWARAKVADLMNRDLDAIQRGRFPEELKREIVTLGVEFQLTTQFTSFVAVEELIVTTGGKARTVRVPVEMPDGVSHEGVFGSLPAKMARNMVMAAPMLPTPSPAMEAVDAPDSLTGDSILPDSKLAGALQGLAERVARDGRDGNFSDGRIKVTGYEIEVMVLLQDLSEQTRSQLTELGFVLAQESKTTSLLLGTIDVRKLEKLAELSAVIRIDPLG